MALGGAAVHSLPAASQLAAIAERFEELVSLATSSALVTDRFTGAAVLDRSQAAELGVVGVAGRASGLPFDARVAHPFTTPFDEDVEHATYDPEWANRYWRVLATVDAVMKEHRGRFRGKVRPSTSSGVRLT